MIIWFLSNDLGLLKSHSLGREKLTVEHVSVLQDKDTEPEG